MSQPMIRAVLFDLDETLLDREQTLELFASAQYRRLPQLHHIGEARYVLRFVELDSHGKVWKDRVYQRLIEEFDIEGINATQLLHEYVTRFCESCVGFPGLHAMLDTLTRRGYQLGIITNGPTPFQEHNIAALGIVDYFRAIVVSQAVKLCKPEPMIFHHALRQLGMELQEAIYVGDNPDDDIAAAQAVGMKAIWRDCAHWGACNFADGVCYTLEELPALVVGLIKEE